MVAYEYGLKSLLVFAFGFTAGVVVAVVWFYAREWIVRALGITRPTPEELLVRACHGDGEQADRLIAAELHASPTIARDEATVRARKALRRDKR